MIHLDLGAEPLGLRDARIKGLKRTAQLRENGSPLKEGINGYSEPSRRVLYERQHGKCAWCERPVGMTGNPVEHVRPKLGAARNNAPRDPFHYWWLAWTWTNLVFSCASCNSQANKGNKYWLEDGTVAASEPTLPLVDYDDPRIFDVALERPLLVHPRLEDPLDFLKWVPINREVALSRWRWTLVGHDAGGRGDATLAMVGLRNIEDEVNNHLRHTVVARHDRISRELVANRSQAALEVWQELLGCLDDPRFLFRAALYWAIDSIWPKRERVRLNFPEPAKPKVTWVAGAA